MREYKTFEYMTRWIQVVDNQWVDGSKSITDNIDV